MTSSLYIGIFFGSIWIDRLISKLGFIRSYIVMTAITTVLVLIQSLWIDPYFWSVIRCLAGICMAGVFIVIESWILVQETPAQRGAILSLYLALFYGALSAGQLLIKIADPTTAIPFWIIALLSALSILPLRLSASVEPKIENPVRLSTTALFKISPLGLIGVVISGIILAAVYGLVPVYAKEIGLSIDQIGNLMALLVFGGLCFQWPPGKLADLGHRRKVLLSTSILTAICSFMIALPAHISRVSFSFGFFLWRIFIHNLSLEHGARLRESQ